jgi:hypothetical protein
MNSIVQGLIALITCLCFYLLQERRTEIKAVIWIIYALVFAFTFYLFFSKLVYRILNPEIWDFTCFYLWGKVAVEGYNFYLPESSQLVFNSLHIPINVSQAFVDLIVNVGFQYPPPTMLLFMPLGYLSYQPAMIIWTVFNLFFLIGSIYLIYTLFFKRQKLYELILVLILFFIYSPVRLNMYNSQTNFILLFLLILFIKCEYTRFAGIFLALAIVIKPFMIIFIVPFILKKNWDAIKYFILSLLLIAILTVIVFGIVPFKTYVFDNPITQRLPKWVLFQDSNQSLQGFLLQNKMIHIDKLYIYSIISFVIFILTIFYVKFLFQRKLFDYIWSILLIVTLLVYPNTWNHYGVLLLFILFQFFDTKGQLGFNMYWAIPIITFFYLLITLSLFAANCFLLFTIILKSFNPFFIFNMEPGKKLIKKYLTV